MDYKNYKLQTEILQKQIRMSEAERQELEHKFHNMYREKQECEKSIIKSLQIQHKKQLEEKRRRAERNENILRTLERIDYQASILAAKTERLKLLKKQYEQYLMNLWGVKRNQAHSAFAQQPVKRAQTAATTMTSSTPSYISKYLNYNYPTQMYRQYYDTAELSNQNNGGTNNNNVNRNNREIKSDLVKCLSSTNMNTPTSYNYNYYQDIAANPIKVNNENILRSQQPSTSSENVIESEHFQFTSNYPKQQSNKFNVYNEPTLSMLNDSQLHKPQNLTVDIKSTKTFNPMCQQNNSLLGEKFSTNYSLYSSGSALNIPTTSMQTASSSLSSSVLQGQTQDASSYNAMPKSIPNITVHLSDDEDTEDNFDDKVSQIEGNWNNRRLSVVNQTEMNKIPLKEIENFLSDESPTILESTEVKKISKINLSSSYPLPFIVTDSQELLDQSLDNQTDFNGAEEKADRNITQRATTPPNFIIPKIVVEPQFDMQTATPVSQYNERENQITKQTPDTNHLLENQIDSSISSKATYISKANNNHSPVENSSINHYDKQHLIEDEQEKLSTQQDVDIHENLYDEEKDDTQKEEQQHKQYQQLRIENETQESIAVAATTNPHSDTIEQKTTIKVIETNNSNLSVDENIVDRGIRTTKEIINNNNTDTANDENTTNRIPNSTTAIELNDKINKIYQKIEKIEDEYYGEKVKIVENFDNAEKRGNGNVEDDNTISQQEQETNPITEFIEESKGVEMGRSLEAISENSQEQAQYDYLEPQQQYLGVEEPQNYGNEPQQYQGSDLVVADQQQYQIENSQVQQEYQMGDPQVQMGDPQTQVQFGDPHTQVQFVDPQTQVQFLDPQIQVPTGEIYSAGDPQQYTQGQGDFQQYPDQYQTADSQQPYQAAPGEYQQPYPTETLQQYPIENQTEFPQAQYPIDPTQLQTSDLQQQPTDATNYNYYAEPQAQYQENQYAYDTNVQSFQDGYQNVEQQQNYDDQNFNYNYGNQEEAQNDYNTNYYGEQQQNTLPPQSVGDENQTNPIDHPYLDQQNEANQNYDDSLQQIQPQQNLDNVEQYPQYPNNDNYVTEYSYQEEYNASQTTEQPTGNENQIKEQENEDIDYVGIEKQNYEQPETATQKYENNANDDTEIEDSFTTTTSTEATTPTSTTTTTKSEQIKKKKSVEFLDTTEKQHSNDNSNSINLPDDAQSTAPTAGAPTTKTSTPKDEVKMIKKLLGDESDDNSIKSNIVQSIEKENMDESDFDFSTNSEVN